MSKSDNSPNQTPTVEELIHRAANGDEDAVDLLSVDQDAIVDDTADQDTADDSAGDPDATADDNGDTPHCDFCGHALSSSTTWATHGPDYDYVIRSYLCPNCRTDARGSVTTVEKDGWPTTDDEDDQSSLGKKLERERSPNRGAQSPFNAAVYIDDRFPDGQYKIVRVEPHVLELRPPEGVSTRDLKHWTEHWSSWTNAVVYVDEDTLRFVDNWDGQAPARGQLES